MKRSKDQIRFIAPLALEQRIRTIKRVVLKFIGKQEVQTFSNNTLLSSLLSAVSINFQ